MPCLYLVGVFPSDWSLRFLLSKTVGSDPILEFITGQKVFIAISQNFYVTNALNFGLMPCLHLKMNGQLF